MNKPEIITDDLKGFSSTEVFHLPTLLEILKEKIDWDMQPPEPLIMHFKDGQSVFIHKDTIMWGGKVK